MGTDVSVACYRDKIDQMHIENLDCPMKKSDGESPSERRADPMHQTTPKGGESVAFSADTWGSEFFNAEPQSEHGFVLVDLKGDKILQEDREFLVGCEVRTSMAFLYAPFSIYLTLLSLSLTISHYLSPSSFLFPG
jgi:hypothetical protein